MEPLCGYTLAHWVPNRVALAFVGERHIQPSRPVFQPYITMTDYRVPRDARDQHCVTTISISDNVQTTVITNIRHLVSLSLTSHIFSLAMLWPCSCPALWHGGNPCRCRPCVVSFKLARCHARRGPRSVGLRAACRWFECGDAHGAAARELPGCAQAHSADEARLRQPAGAQLTRPSVAAAMAARGL